MGCSEQRLERNLAFNKGVLVKIGETYQAEMRLTRCSAELYQAMLALQL